MSPNNPLAPALTAEQITAVEFIVMNEIDMYVCTSLTMSRELVPSRIIADIEIVDEHIQNVIQKLEGDQDPVVLVLLAQILEIQQKIVAALNSEGV